MGGEVLLSPPGFFQRREACPPNQRAGVSNKDRQAMFCSVSARSGDSYFYFIFFTYSMSPVPR